MIKIHLQNDSAATAPPLPVTEARPAPVNDWAVQPEVFFLELTNHCNMHCTFCPSDYLKKERGNADDDLAVRFIEEVRDLGLNKPIQFNVLGEPLLNKKIYKYIDLCEQYGIEVYLISNFAILDAERAKKIFQHDNVALVLSLQTPTEDSYKRMRGYDKLNFEQYFDRIFPALREKFAAGSESRVEVHVTSTSNMRADSTIQSDFDLNMWDPFDIEDKDAFVLNLLNRFDGFSEQLRAEFPEQFEAERVRSLEQYAEQLGRNHLAASRDTIPDGAIDMTEDQFWGYMFAPNCFIRFKTFGLWTKEETFMKTFLPKESVVYVEEREEALDCSMAHNVSMLADGQMSLCCLDYEGEMGLPNMRDTSIVELLRAPEREAIAKDSMKSEVCRRCQGNIFVFDSEAKDERATKFDKFGRGWHPFEPDMNGIGGRWSNGNGWLYFLARQDSNILNLRIMSIYDSATPLTVQVRVQEGKEFGDVVQQQVFFGVQNQMIDAELPVSLKQGQLYRVDLLSPTFVPAEAHGGDDRRSLGIMLFEAGVRQGELKVVAPVAEPEPAPVPQPEPVAVAEVASGGRFKRWLSALTGKP